MSKIRLHHRIANRPGGFTLSEMLLVVALIAVLSGLAGGLYVGTYKRLLVEKAARDFLLAAKYGRTVAVEQQRNYELLIDPNRTGFMLITSLQDPNTGETQQIIVRDYYCKPVEFQGEVKFEQVLIGAGEGQTGEVMESQAIIFQPSGCSDAAVVQIGDGKTHYSIGIVPATGKATMYFGTAEQVENTTVDLDAQEQ